MGGFALVGSDVSRVSLFVSAGMLPQTIVLSFNAHIPSFARLVTLVELFPG